MIAVQLAVMIDAGQRLVSACYFLEGDGALALHAYDTIMELEEHCTNCQYPNTRALARHVVGMLPGLSPANQQARVDALVQTHTALAQPAFMYWLQRINSEDQLGPVKSLMEAARLCNPLRICHIADAKVHDLLERFKPAVFGVATIAERAAPIAMLIGELAGYRSRASKLNEVAITDLMQWWRQNGATLPRWFALTCTVVLFQPSSAGAERVFSMLDGMFDADQAAALEDYKTGPDVPLQRHAALQAGGCAAPRSKCGSRF